MPRAFGLRGEVSPASATVFQLVFPQCFGAKARWTFAPEGGMGRWGRGALTFLCMTMASKANDLALSQAMVRGID